MPRTRPKAARTLVHLRLRDLVQADGRSVAAIAEAAGLNPEGLRQILRGERPNPTADTLERLLDALGLTWSALD